MKKLILLIVLFVLRFSLCCFAENEEQLNELKIPNNKPLLRCTSYVYDVNDRLLEFYVAVVNGKYIVNE